jgi:creatinine amidohydrolase
MPPSAPSAAAQDAAAPPVAPPILRWERITKAAFDRIDRARAVVLVTCSPIEVHGPHLPLGADALEGDGLAHRMVRFLPERHRDRIFLQLPFIYVAADPLPQPGSLQFEPGMVARVLEGLGRTLAAQGFRDIVVSNFHGSPRHVRSIEQACERVNRARPGTRMVPLFSAILGRITREGRRVEEWLGAIEGVREEDLRGDMHGGFIETSQLLALHRDWVDGGFGSLPRRTIDTWLEALGEAPAQVPYGKKASFGRLVRAFRASIRFFRTETYSGAPARASAEAGERILDAFGAKAAEVYTEVLDGALAPAACHSHLWPLRVLFLNPVLIRVLNLALGYRSAII